MYFILKEGKLKEIIQKALKKAKSQKELLQNLKIPKSKIWSYQQYNIALTEERLTRIADYAEVKIEKEDIEKELPNNWRQKIGGINCVKKKIKNGTLNLQLKKSRASIKEHFSEWHERMKKENPEKYHLIQYERFKKIGGYKFTTNKGEKVRNIFEKEVADLLIKYKIDYKYEPLIKAKDKYFFPDFLIKDNIILECTMWRGYDKAFKLKLKINELEDKYKVYVIIPKKIEKYYKSIKENLILGLEDFENLLKSMNIQK